MTIISQPVEYQSINFPLVYTVYDAGYTQDNYKYVFEVWIDGTKVFSAKIFPDNNGYGSFDASSIVRQYANLELKPETTVREFLCKDVQIKIREEVGGYLSSVLATSTAINVFNYYQGRFDTVLIADKFKDYENRILTDRPFIKIPENCTTFYIPFYDSTNNLISVSLDDAGTSFGVTPTTTDPNCQNINIADLTIGYDDTLIINSEIGQNIKCYVECAGLYDNYIVHFLNKWGGYESVLFNKVSRKTYDIQRKDFQQNIFEINSSGAVIFKDNNILKRQKKTFATRWNEKLKLSTDLLTNEEYQWLQQLILSTDIYVQKLGETVIYPCTLTDTNYEFKEIIVDGLTQLTINIEFGQQYKTQYN